MTELVLVTSKDMELQLGNVYDKVYIGLWCLQDLEKVENQKLISLPWSDEHIKRKDFGHIQDLYEKYLPLLVKQLNDVHNKSYQVEFWELVIGAWLQTAISIFYQRLELIDKSFEKHSITSVGVFKRDYRFEAPIDYNEFISFFQDSDWNDYIFSKIVRMKKNSVKFIEVEGRENRRSNSSNKFNLKKVVGSYIGIVNANASSFIKPTVFFHNSYFSRENERALSKALGQFPQIMPIRLSLPKLKTKSKLRSGLVLNEKSEKDNIILSLLIDQMPKVYLEGFKQVEKTALRCYPNRVKAILTGNSDISDDYFKVWAAHQKLNNVPLLISQHGGCYGLSELTQNEIIQRKYASKFYTWGWKEDGINNLFPMPAPKLVPHSNIKSLEKRSQIIVTLYDVPMYTYRNQSFPVGEKMLDYMDSVESFIENCKAEVRDDLVMRLYPNDFGWGLKKRLERLLEDYNFDKTPSLIKSMEGSKLCITTCNATTFLEFIVSGIPTIAFWEEELFSLRESAIGSFSELKKVGIFHESASEAAKFVNCISDDIDSWWSSEEVQQAREQFCLTYAHTSKNWLVEWRNELDNIELTVND